MKFNFLKVYSQLHYKACLSNHVDKNICHMEESDKIFQPPTNSDCKDSVKLLYNIHKSRQILFSGRYRGVAMVSAETPSENRTRPNLLTSHRVSDKIATCVIEGFSTGKNLHNLAFEITIITFYSRLRPFYFWSSTYS